MQVNGSVLRHTATGLRSAAELQCIKYKAGEKDQRRRLPRLEDSSLVPCIIVMVFARLLDIIEQEHEK